MKKNVLICLLMAFLCAFSAKAENYPYRSDYFWVTTPDHANWLYKTGENATVDIQFFKYGIPRDGVVEYAIGDDMLPADRHGKMALKGGRATLEIGTRKSPGFRDVQLSVKVDGVEYQHHVKVGFSPEKILPWTQEPKDFLSFWEKNISDMRSIPLTYTKERADEYCTDKIDCYLVKLKIDRDNHYLYGYLFYPKGATERSCPVVLCPPGAGVKTIKEPLRHRYYAENGFIRFETEIHGLDPRLPNETFDDLSHAFGNYLTQGIDSRDRYYMKHVYLGLIRSLDLLCSLPEWDGSNVAVQGGSQGGALSLVAAGLDKRVTQCVVNHPALSDMGAYSEKGRTGGYPHFNKYADVLTSQNINTLLYYDVVNFSRHVTCPVYMTWGYNDNVCPPTTSYAVWNTLTNPKESLITPVNEHWTSDDTEYGQMQWILERVKRGK